MSGRYRVESPVTDYTGDVGELHFAKGVYEGDVPDGALVYFNTAGYAVTPLQSDAKASGDQNDGGDPPEFDLPAKSATRPEWEQAGIDLGLTEDEVKGAANKDDLIEAVTNARDAKASGDQNGDPA